jgi:hypothetical protein
MLHFNIGLLINEVRSVLLETQNIKLRLNGICLRLEIQECVRPGSFRTMWPGAGANNYDLPSNLHHWGEPCVSHLHGSLQTISIIMQPVWRCRLAGLVCPARLSSRG